MALSILHSFQSGIQDSAVAGLIKPSNWNAGHHLYMDQGRLVGRTTASPAVAHEIAPTGGLAMGNGEIYLTDMSLTPGSYAFVSLTVDAKGRITAIANGPGGGSAVLAQEWAENPEDDDVTPGHFSALHWAAKAEDSATAAAASAAEAATFDPDEFATAAQGELADSAVQPGDIGAVATSNDYDDLTNLPTLGTAAAAATGDFATAAQGALADSSLQAADIADAFFKSTDNSDDLTEGSTKLLMTIAERDQLEELVGVVTALTDTGAVDTAYGGGVIPVMTVSGRTTAHQFALIASQNCRLQGPSRAVAIASIYGWAKGLLSALLAARQSNALIPQAVIAGAEECWARNGFRSFIAGSIYSGTENESGYVIGSRSSFGNGRNGGAIGSDNAVVGRGFGAFFSLTVVAGAITAVVAELPGEEYQVGDVILFLDRTSAGSGGTAEVASVDGSGGILTVTVNTGGTGYSSSTTVDAYVDNGLGDFSVAIATVSGCRVEGTASAAMACAETNVTGDAAAAVACDECDVGGDLAFAAGSALSTASGDGAAVIASSAGVASAALAVVLSGNNAQSTAGGAVVVGRRVINDQARSIALGDAVSGSALTANRKFHAFANGAVQAAGTITGSVTFTDYAEFFENASHGVIPLGVLVALEGRKVRPAQPGDDILGVVSATALVVAGDSPFTWGGRYLTGEFGEMLYEDVPDGDWKPLIPNPEWPRSVPNPEHPKYDYVQMADDKGKPYTQQVVASTPTIPNPLPAPMIPNPVPQGTERAPKENPAFDPSIPNTPRSQRPDAWSCIGLLGQVHVRVAGDLAPGEFVAAGVDGIGVLSPDEPTNVKVMEIRQPFDAEKGYAVAFCLIR